MVTRLSGQKGLDLVERVLDGIMNTGAQFVVLGMGESKYMDLFARGVDSAAVYLNCSTRFTDGGEFGLGAEIGISTQKLHARGPMGLEEMTSWKYVISGTGQVR